MAPLKYSGSAMFRQRIVASLLTNRPLKIDRIRVQDQTHPGLQDFEANFLRLIELITDGTQIEINETGTTLRFKPGILVGGTHTHDCGLTRSIGYFVEGLLPLAPFCKTPLHLTLQGLTNDDLDLSVDVLQAVTLPILANFGLYNVVCKIKSRGVPPKGGGVVELHIPTVRESLQSVYMVEEGLVKRVRGIAFTTRVSPSLSQRMIESCRGVLNDFLPDVHVSADHYNKEKGGHSPGLSLSLFAETTTGALLSVERTARMRRNNPVPGLTDEHVTVDNGPIGLQGEGPETIGSEAAQALLRECFSGGVIDSTHQSLVLFLMALTPEEVSKVRLGALTVPAVETLRLLREAFGVTFRIVEDRSSLALQDSHKKKKRRSESDGGSDEESEYGSIEDLEANNSGGDNNDDEEDDNDEDEEGEEESSGEENESEEEEGEDSAEEDGDNSDGQKDSDDEDGMDEEDSDEDEGEEDGEGENARRVERVTFLLSCLGTGHKNTNRRVT